jgi:hypothetical protein
MSELQEGLDYRTELRLSDIIGFEARTNRVWLRLDYSINIAGSYRHHDVYRLFSLSSD